MDYEKLFLLPTGVRKLFLKIKFVTRRELYQEIRAKYESMMAEIKHEKDIFACRGSEFSAIKVLALFYCKSISQINKIVKKIENKYYRYYNYNKRR